MTTTRPNSESVAIVGMSGRFPGAETVEAFWSNLVAGVESISTFTDDELAASGLDVSALRKNPASVPARGILENPEWFDAAFFGMTAKQAEVTDPQQRLFLEAAWEALENSGYDPSRVDGPIGVYAGSGDSTYYLNNLRSRPDVTDLVGERVVSLGNEKDYLATWVAYKLNLRGPAISINTACSTSLVAVCQGCQSLLNYQCDLALAGGLWITFPQRRCVFFQEGGIFSSDGHCRPFDARAQGTVSSEGGGVVVLKRLSEALADGDHIYAVIKGFGLNNDGSDKVGFTAPSVEGQAEAVATAIAEAEFDPATISYVECHGTATPIGDPIEIAGLTRAFRLGTDEKNFCAIGSVKSNIGHLGAGAGVAGLIKTSLALQHKLLPPSLNFSRPNPKIDFAETPFFVNSALREWKDVPLPRRAGVSSFGLGGTNAHVVLEERPEPEPSDPSRPWQLLILSAKTEPALRAASDRLLDHFKANPSLELADAAYTLQQGRQVFAHRQMLVCRDSQDAIQTLQARDPRRISTHRAETEAPSVVFLFPGQGAQHVGMAADLYGTEPLFKENVDRCAEFLAPRLGIDLRELIYPDSAKVSEAEALLTETRIAQPALFVIEYALATLWMSWGIRPAAMIGHSIGEFVAACLAGVFSLEEALALVAQRGQLMQNMPRGKMLAISIEESNLEKILPAELSLAAVNGPSRCVVSGPTAEIDAFEKALAVRGVTSTALHTSHAFHSSHMDPILQSFAQSVGHVKRGPSTIPFISNLTGTWISDEEARDPQYWARHLRHTVRFAAGMSELLQNDDCILLEVGPGTTLSSLSKLQAQRDKGKPILSSLRHVREDRSDVECVLTALGQLWLHGIQVDWTAFYSAERRRRVILPTYPFQRERYWIEPRKRETVNESLPLSSRRSPDIADWFYVPSWKRSALLNEYRAPAQGQNWLLFSDELSLGASIAGILASSQLVTQVRVGTEFRKEADGSFVIDPSRAGDYERLVSELERSNRLPQRIVHLWSVTRATPESQADAAWFEGNRATGFDSLLFLAQAFQKRKPGHSVRVDCISSNTQEVIGEEVLCAAKTPLLGLCKVISQEIPNVQCRSIDIVPAALGAANSAQLATQLTAEMLSDHTEPVVAYRGMHRWVQTFEPVRLENTSSVKLPLKKKGVYLITGGLGRIGLALAEFLARNYSARLILMGRSGLPEKHEWSAWLKSAGMEAQTSRRISRLLEIEALGGEVITLAVDIADREAVREGIAAACARFGKIDGVIHGAGIAGPQGRAFIPDTNRAHCNMHFRAKAHGLLALDEALRDKNIDFFLLLSSLSTILGGLGLAAYAAANQFMDTYAQSRNRLGTTRWMSVNWDAWKNAEENTASTGAALAEFSLTPDEGAEAFQRILCNNSQLEQVVVSTGDLNSRIAEWLQPRLSEDHSALQPAATAPSHRRPEVRTIYVPAENETERSIAGIWESLFGISQVGIHDNFFDLGGDSLLLLRVQDKIQELLDVNLSVAEMFQHPTVEALARRISQPAPELAGMDATLDRAQLQRAALARHQQAARPV